jgi:hypothetical protein
MKKAITTTVVASLSLALLAMSVGCGGGENNTDKGSAKELMQSGDIWIEKAGSDFKNITTYSERIMETIDGNNGNAESLMQEMESASQNMGDSLDNAKSAFQAITTLTDARDYKDYANVMLELIARYEQFLSTQGEIQKLIAQGGAPPTGAGAPSGMMPPPGSDTGTPQNGSPPAGATPPSGMTPPAGNDRGAFQGGMTSDIENLKAEAEAIKSERNL